MSDLMPSADVLECPPGLASAPVLESYPAREAALPGGLTVRRALPRAARRMVGPWCFLDHYGPLAFGVGKPMDIGAASTYRAADGDVADCRRGAAQRQPGQRAVDSAGPAQSHDRGVGDLARRRNAEEQF